jgi:hypothetical protein
MEPDHWFVDEVGREHKRFAVVTECNSDGFTTVEAKVWHCVADCPGCRERKEDLKKDSVVVGNLA